MERAYPCIVTQIFKTVGRVLAPSVCKLLLGARPWDRPSNVAERPWKVFQEVVQRIDECSV
eukprot:7391073-Prymnesium_polylepis.1